MARKKVVRRKFSEAKKLKVLNQLSKTNLSTAAFSKKAGISTGQLYNWQKEFKNTKQTKKARKRGGPYSPDERKQAVENFLKSGMTQDDFAKTWGCSTKSLATWVQLYNSKGHKGLERSSFKGENTKRRGPKGIPEELKKQIIETKTKNDTFGLRKIKDFLRRFRGVSVCTRTISKTLKEEEIPLCPQVKKRTRSSDRIRTFERALPMQLWQTDITSYVLTRQGQRVYFTVFMDDCSRYVVSWSLQLMQTSEFVMNTLLDGIQRFGKPQEVLTDQGRQYFSWRGKSKFQNLLLREGIEHVVARSHHPQTVGKCERFWETVGKEFWERVRPQDLKEAKERLGHFINHYNHFRPHQGLDGMVPADRFFGIESEVRKVLEETIEKNSLRLALKEGPRSPVFLIGQIGNTPLSMHGESGRLVFQTPDGSIQRLCYENFGHNLTKGVTHGTESRDNERKETKGETQGLQDSSSPSTSGEDFVEASDAGGKREGAHERSCAYGVLDRESEQDRDSQAFGDSPSENLATLSASYLRDACGTALATQDESEGHGSFHGGRSEETQEENNGSGRAESETGEIDSRPSNDAECLRNENNDEGIVGGGEDGCRRANRNTRESFVWQWENFFTKKQG